MMHPAEKFMSWLEGYFDANKNSITKSQVKEIRKKMIDFQKGSDILIPLNEPAYYRPATPSTSEEESYPIPEVINEEFLKEVERQKNASTMEELSPAS